MEILSYFKHSRTLKTHEVQKIQNEVTKKINKKKGLFYHDFSYPKYFFLIPFRKNFYHLGPIFGTCIGSTYI